MGAFLNQFQYLGHLGKDATLEVVGEKDTPVCKFSLGVTRSTRGRSQPTDWFPIEVWGKYGEAVAPHLKKGMMVLVVGYNTAEAWKTNDQQSKKTYHWVATNVQFIASKDVVEKTSKAQEEEPF